MSKNNKQNTAAFQEIELKLRVDPENALDFFDLPLLLNLTKAAPVTHDLHSTYYDTDDYALIKAGFGLRVRDKEGTYIQTVKTSAKMIDGLHQRGEWEAALSNNAIDLTQVFDPIIRAKINEIAEESTLMPIFTTTFSRTSVICHLDDDNQIELCLDQGEIKAGQSVIPICEIELELVKGNKIYALFQVAAEVAQHIEVALDIHSKAWQGYRLHKLQAMGAPLPTPEKIEPMNAQFFLREAEKYYHNS